MEKSSAVISDCGLYRYLLTRPSEVAEPYHGPLLFIMLNPSTADASIDDPTIRRCRAFAKAWGHAGIVVANLYAYRAKEPKELLSCADPIGPENDQWLEKLALEHNHAVCAWGADADPARAAVVHSMFDRMMCITDCLGTTKSGAPRHPLYVKGSTKLTEFKPVVPA